MPLHNKTRRYTTYRECEEMVQNVLAQMIEQSYSPLVIMGIGRGGILPAAMLGYMYGIKKECFPEVLTIYAWSYMQDGTHKTREGIKIDWPPPSTLKYYADIGTNVLIVDDLTDTGETLAAFKEKFPLSKTATLIHKESSSFEPDFFGRRCATPAPWFVFPWERVKKRQSTSGPRGKVIRYYE